MPKAFNASIHVKVQKPRAHRSSVQETQCSFLLPHEVFHHYYHHKKDKFVELFLGGNEGKPTEFWTEVLSRKDPRLQDHDMVKNRDDWLTKAIPISYHGDAVPCLAIGKSGTKSFDVISWQPTLATSGGSLLLKNYISGMFQDNKLKHSKGDEFDTDEEIGEILFWSLKTLYEGKWPSHDHRGVEYAAASSEGALAGQALADGYFAVPWIIKCDLEYVANYLHLRHYGSTTPCDHCPCTTTGSPEASPSNFGSTSTWIRNLHSAQQWRALYPITPHWLFKFSFLSCLNIEPDELHVVHLGTSMWFLGSVLWVMVFKVLPGGAAANIRDVWERIVRAYEVLCPPAQYTNLSLSAFCDPAKPSGHFPKLKGKGAEVKGLVGALSIVWGGLMDSSKHEHNLIKAALDQVLKFQNIIDDFSQDLFLPQEQVRALQNHVHEFLRIYTELAHIADQQGLLLWNMAPKFHFLWHLAQRAEYLCPRRSACHIDEDYVGQVKKIAQACSAGTQLHHIAAKVVEKIRWGKGLQ